MFKMTSLDDLSQKVWAADSVDAKKAVLREMVEAFKVKGKRGVHVQHFVTQIDVATCPKVLDKMAANLALNITDKVVRVV